jgi:hypothetical protein
VKGVGELGGPTEVPPLLEVLLAAKGPDAATAEAALSAICARARDRDACAAPILAAEPKAPAETRQALLRVLGSCGAPKALAAVKGAMNDADPAVANAAVQALSDWPTHEALGDLLTVIRSSKNPAHVTLATKGCVRLARDPEASVADRLALCAKTMDAAQRIEDKKLVLGGIGSIVAPEALTAALAYLKDEKLREDAGLAAVTIGEKLVRGNPQAVAAAMVKVKESVKGQGLQKRADALYKRATAMP